MNNNTEYITFADAHGREIKLLMKTVISVTGKFESYGEDGLMNVEKIKCEMIDLKDGGNLKITPSSIIEMEIVGVGKVMMNPLIVPNK